MNLLTPSFAHMTGVFYNITTAVGSSLIEHAALIINAKRRKAKYFYYYCYSSISDQ
jgi:hypothetical protein